MLGDINAPYYAPDHSIRADQRREPSMKLLAVVIVAFLSMASVTALAHSGGTDSKGCHRNHKTGDYHCH
ncbi:hypothetical protein ALP94_03153 [Pseudomonas savastanoi pv. glycinea]|nr:hypothetical protein ALP94_03153 [Pseudomonas savastanoi pv. glycinea]